MQNYHFFVKTEKNKCYKFVKKPRGVMFLAYAI